MDDLTFISNYFKKYKKSLFETDVSEQLKEMKKMLLNSQKNKKKVMIAGNGGSAAIASHVSVDLTKAGNIRSINFKFIIS